MRRLSSSRLTASQVSWCGHGGLWPSGGTHRDLSQAGSHAPVAPRIVSASGARANRFSFSSSDQVGQAILLASTRQYILLRMNLATVQPISKSIRRQPPRLDWWWISCSAVAAVRCRVAPYSSRQVAGRAVAAGTGVACLVPSAPEAPPPPPVPQDGGRVRGPQPHRRQPDMHAPCRSRKAPTTPLSAARATRPPSLRRALWAAHLCRH